MIQRITPVAVALLVVTSIAAAPVSATLLNDTPQPEIVRYGSAGNPSFIVEYENSSLSSLKDWTNASSERQLLRVHNASNTATIAAPKTQVDASLLERVLAGSLSSNMLTSKSYIQDVDVNYRLNRTEPVSLINKSSFSKPQEGVTSFDDPAFPTEGIAFNGDANTTTMNESKDVLGVNNVSQTGAGEKIAIIDTGANTASGQIFGNGSSGSSIRILNASKNFITNSSVNVSKGDYSAISDANGHGTWTAAAAAGANGIAPKADLLVLKALDEDGSGSTSNIASAIRYAADEHASVVSLSLGSTIYSDAIADAVQYARQQGSVVVVAAGNSRQTRSPGLGSPADVSGVISVGATNGSEAPTAASAYFSQYSGRQVADGNASNSEQVDVAAPGMQTQVQVATTDGTVQNSTLSGTSMATPMVAGGVLLALDANPDWNVSTTSKWVRKGARPVPHAAESEVGHGMFAADNTISKTKPSQSQTDAMTTAASQRDSFYEVLSDSQGGILTDLREVAA